MSKVLAFHNSQTGNHWFTSKEYGSNEIDAIRDPQGGDTQQSPTSIPSPFARFDLVRSAFANLARNPKLEGTMNDKKLVSEALDLGELLFNFDNFQNNIKIVSWNRDNLEELLQPGSVGHNRLGKALDLYLKQDAQSYNFDKINRLFIVFYQGEVIGGTSPSTVFFTSANVSKHKGIKFGDQVLLGGNPVPLYQRDIEYQKMWYSLKNMPDFRRCFREVSEYLEYSEQLLRSNNQTLYYQHIRNQNGTELLTEFYNQNLIQLTAGGANDILEVIGFDLRKKRVNPLDIQNTSGFTIKSTRYRALYPDEKQFPMPLALQNKFSRTITYTKGSWKSSTIVPAFSSDDWRQNKRQLPDQEINYPWLTVSDFLEPYLVKVNYPVNTDAFFNGNSENTPKNKGYLLPLKKDFFDFFDLKDLETGRVQLTLNCIGEGTVNVSLKFPIESRNGNQEHILFERTYLKLGDDTRKPDLTTDNPVGLIIEQKFTVNIYPFIKSGQYSLPADYRIQLIEKKTNNLDIRLSFIDFDKNKSIPIEKEQYRSPREGGRNDISKYFVLENEFDYIQIQFENTNHQVNAVIVPKWPRYDGQGNKFTFAVDFGTTNTHIEYKIDNGISRRYEMTKPLVATLVAPNQYNETIAGFSDLELYLPLRFEFLPVFINDSSKEKFPIRTALAHPKYLNTNLATHTLLDYNIPFYYEQEPERSVDEVKKNLKWASNDSEGRKRITSYLEEIVMMIKSKVISEGGNLEETKILWFYPSSMTNGQIGNLKRTWDDLFKKHISQKLDYIRPVSESLAPFYHYRKARPNLLATNKPSVSIDIGGGTTDVVIFEGKTPKSLSSFRFAGNSIYGDGFREMGSNHNGFVIKYASKIEEILEANGLDNLLDCHKNAQIEQNSAELISLWFAIEKNELANRNKDLSFSNMLSHDSDMKIVFVLFYSAIIYHVAKMLKSQGKEMPKNISFSGTGSKLIGIISPNDDQIKKLTKVIFEKVFDSTYDLNDNLEFFTDRAIPKEATCKGALEMDNQALQILAGDINEVYAATYNDEFTELTYNDFDKSEIKNSILKEVTHFLDFFFDLNKEFNFKNELDVNSEFIKIARDVTRVNLSSYLDEAISLKKAANVDDDTASKVEETMFFYPLIGAINHLAYCIGSQSKLS
ncbi:MAG: hypothetical protein ACK4UP_03225 [Spirosomataceae bacterium]